MDNIYLVFRTYLRDLLRVAYSTYINFLPRRTFPHNRPLRIQLLCNIGVLFINNIQARLCLLLQKREFLLCPVVLLEVSGCFLVMLVDGLIFVAPGFMDFLGASSVLAFFMPEACMAFVIVRDSCWMKFVGRGFGGRIHGFAVEVFDSGQDLRCEV